MNVIESTIRARQRVLGVTTMVGIVALMVGDILTPHGTDNHITTVSGGLKELNAAAAHPVLLYLSSTFVILGFGGLAVGFGAIATLMRERSARLATVAASIGGFACFSAAIINVWAGLDVYAAEKADMSRSSAAAFLVSAQHTSKVSAVFAAGYLVGLVIAAVLAGVALWRSDAVPRWVGVLFPVSLVVAIGVPGGPVTSLLALPFAVTLFALGLKVVRDSRDVTLSHAVIDGSARPAPVSAGA
jgi:hypothetical protein